jgi:DNA-binding XRE family transcriptional regulator
MNKTDFTYYRKELGKTQREIAELLGTSLKAVHSYEQGWRNIPVHVERQLLFLFSRKSENLDRIKACWEVKSCHSGLKERCPAWEFSAGKLCWFINGTHCEGAAQQSWKEKMALCKACPVFTPLLPR